MKKIVTIGGGTGQSTLLKYLKAYSFDLSAIVTMVDDGGSTGVLRQQLKVLPPGDVRRCLVALAQDNLPLQNLMEWRYQTGDLKNHPAGNIMLAGLEQQTGSLTTAIDIIAQWLKCPGKIIPVTEDQTTLHAILENGLDICGETNIDIPQHDPTLKIKSVYLESVAQANPAAITAITEADYIILTIGDLFTSVIPNLLVAGIRQLLAKITVPIIYTCNCTTKLGETTGYTALDYIKQLEHYLAPRRINYIVVNNNFTHIATTAQAVLFDQQLLQKHGLQVVPADLLAVDGVRTDGKKLAAIINQLCQQ